MADHAVGASRSETADMPKAVGKHRRKRKDLPDFGAYLKDARERLKWSQEEAAKKAGVTQGLIAQYESGKVKDPWPEVLRLLAKAYGKDYLEVVCRLVREKYDPPGKDWQTGQGRERWRVLEATWAESERVEQLRVPPGVVGFTREQLAAKAELVAKAVLLDVKALARWEAVAEVRRFWIFAPDFLADTDHDIQDTVVQNLLKNPAVEYEYFIDRRNGPRFQAYKKRLKEHLKNKKRGGRARDVDRLVRAYRIEEQATQWLSTDHLAADPDNLDKSLVFRYLRQGDSLFAHLLNRDEGAGLINNWKNWARKENELVE